MVHFSAICICVFVICVLGTGKVTLDEFIQWWRSSSNFLRYDAHKWTLAQFAIQLFRFYDELKLGYITKDQYNEGCKMLSQSGNAAYEPWAQQAFEEYDCVNADGYVTMDEFMQYVLYSYYPDHDKEQAEKAHP